MIHFKSLYRNFSVISLNVIDETCIIVESTFHAEFNSLCPNSIHH